MTLIQPMIAHIAVHVTPLTQCPSIVWYEDTQTLAFGDGHVTLMWLSVQLSSDNRRALGLFKFNLDKILKKFEI